MTFEEQVEVKKHQNASLGDEAYLSATKHLTAALATDIDRQIEFYKGKPACGQIVQALRNLRKTLAKAHYTAGVTEMLIKGGDFSHHQMLKDMGFWREEAA